METDPIKLQRKKKYGQSQLQNSRESNSEGASTEEMQVCSNCSLRVSKDYCNILGGRL